jgi:hypothetical protein
LQAAIEFPHVIDNDTHVIDWLKIALQSPLERARMLVRIPRNLRRRRERRGESRRAGGVSMFADIADP